jgi:hypothetical protein
MVGEPPGSEPTGRKASTTMRVHVHPGDNEAVVTHPDVAPDTRIEELIFLEEDELLFKVGDDTDVELDLTSTVEQLSSGGPSHVVRHRCRKPTITVEYGGKGAVFEVPISKTVEKVRDQAIKELRIDKTTAADLVLQLPEADTPLKASDPIGHYVPKHHCELTLDLVHVVRPQG